MVDKIQIRRGIKDNLPILDEGEMGYCTDTKELFVGSTLGNVLLTNEDTAFNNLIAVESVKDLQNKYPEGMSLPVWVISEKGWYYWDGESDVPDVPAPSPTAHPIGGSYNETQYITLSSNEAGTIFYTLDGTIPTPEVGLIYSSPIKVQTQTTLKFMAQDVFGVVSDVYTEIYTISTNLSLRVTDGLMSAYNFRSPIAGIEIPDHIGENHLNMVNFRNPSLSIVSEGVKGDMVGHIVSSPFSNITGSFTFAASLRFERENKGYGNLFSLFERDFNIYHEFYYGDNVAKVEVDRKLINLRYEDGAYCDFYSFEPEMIFVTYDDSSERIGVYFNGLKVFEEAFIPSTVPTIHLFDGYTTNSSVKGQGESIFNAVLMYDRVLSEQEMNTVTSDIKLPRFKNPDRSNYLTTVTEELIAAYDLTSSTFPSDGDYHRSLVGMSYLSISSSPETQFSSDGSLEFSAVIPNPSKIKMGYNTTVAFIGAIEDSGVPFILVASGQKWRYRAEQIWLSIGEKSLSSDNRVSFPNDGKPHTMIVTTEKVESNVNTNIYVDGNLYGTQTVAFDSMTRPYDNRDNLTIDRSRTPKRAMLLYDKTLSSSEVTQLHNDLKDNIG